VGRGGAQLRDLLLADIFLILDAGPGVAYRRVRTAQVGAATTYGSWTMNSSAGGGARL
jgi:hypothetical protein